MSITLNIESIADIQKIKEAILNHDDFKIGEIKPLVYKIKLDGGRFKDYDINYITADVAAIIISEQKNYLKFLNEIEKKLGITFTDESKRLQFKLGEGSLEIIDENMMLEVIKQMESEHLMLVLLGFAVAWFGHAIYAKHIEKELAQINAKKEVTLKELEGAEREEYLNTTNEAIAALKEVALSKPLQDSVNNHTGQILSKLKDDETLQVQDGTEQLLVNTDVTRYEYQEPDIEDIEEILTQEYEISTYDYNKKMFKLSGIAVLANTDILDPLTRGKLVTTAEKTNTLKLEVKIIKDGTTNKIKSLYILDVLS